MQIQLKQREIEAALKLFISQQGINLTGKAVYVEFTSGRKDNGLSAELTIDDVTVDDVTVDTGIPAGLIPRGVEVPAAAEQADSSQELPKSKLFG